MASKIFGSKVLFVFIVAFSLLIHLLLFCVNYVNNMSIITLITRFVQKSDVVAFRNVWVRTDEVLVII